jgi:hypothetical protein
VDGSSAHGAGSPGGGVGDCPFPSGQRGEFRLELGPKPQTGGTQGAKETSKEEGCQEDGEKGREEDGQESPEEGRQEEAGIQKAREEESDQEADEEEGCQEDAPATLTAVGASTSRILSGPAPPRS